MLSFDLDGHLKRTPLHRAAHRCEKAQVQQLLAAGENVHARDTWGYTPLHLVAQTHPHAKASGDLQAEVARMLLDAGADVNAIEIKETTPLHLAALSGSKELVALLLKRGAKVHAHTDNGWTPLHSTVPGGHSSTAQLLLLGGADVNDAQAEYGGEKHLSPSVPEGKYTPLALALIFLQETIAGQQGEGDSDLTVGENREEWRERHQAMADLLRQHGGK